MPTYNNDTIYELDVDTPLEGPGNSFIPELNDAIREIKRALKSHLAIKVKSANYTATDTDEVILVDATTGAVTITLPQQSSVSSASVRKEYTIIKIDSSANAVTVNCYGTETINGSSSKSLDTAYEGITVTGNGGTDWKLLTVLNARHATNADNATNATNADNATNATNADKVDNYHASTTPSASVIPVTADDTKLGQEFLHGLLVASVDVSQNTTQVDFTGLDGNAVHDYVLVATIENPLAVTVNYRLCVNNDTTIINYYTQRLTADNTTIGGARINDSRCASLVAGTNGIMVVHTMRDAYNRFRLISQFNRQVSGIDLVIYMVVHAVPTDTNITSLHIIADHTNGIGAGSKFRLYRRY